MEVIVKSTYEEISALTAQMIAELVHKNPTCVLGLATGETPVGTYKELIRLHNDEGLDFSQVATFISGLALSTGGEPINVHAEDV